MKDEQEKLEPKSEAGGGIATETPPEKNGATNEPAQTPLTHTQMQELKDKAAKADEYWNRLLREAADFENYKKRAARERQDALKYANEGLLQKLLPILDNFEMALSAANADGGSTDAIKKGVEMIHSQLKSALLESGLEEIDAANKKFDPNFHEAVSQKETADVPEDQVVQQVRKGYKFRDRLIRPATVVVAKKP